MNSSLPLATLLVVFSQGSARLEKGNVLYIKTVRLGLAGKRRSERQFHRLSPQGCLAS